MSSHVKIGYHQSLNGCFAAIVMRLRPASIGAALVQPSTPPLFHRVEQHFFERQRHLFER